VSHRPRYCLLLDALPDADGVPAVVRLRRALKTLLRRDNLRAVDAIELPDGDPLGHARELVRRAQLAEAEVERLRGLLEPGPPVSVP
jgi:hypothetical protein